jgi:hypothetical protein
MADYQVTFTLNALYTGTTEADDFTIIGKHANGSPSDTTIATGVTKAQLTTGVTYTVVDTITGGTVTSTGTCTNSVNWLGLGGSPTPTSTPIPTSQPFTGDLEVTLCTNPEQTYHVSSQEICVGGNLQLANESFVVGNVIQIAIGTDCPHGATYCATVQSTNNVAARDAIITLDQVLVDCSALQCTE